VLIQYEGRLQELQAGLAHGRVQQLASAGALIVSAALFLTLGLGAIRQRIPLLVALAAPSNRGRFGEAL